MFFDENYSKQFDYNCLEPAVWPFITDSVEAMNTLTEKGTMAAKALTQLKCLEERKKMRSTLQINYLVGLFSIQTSDTYLNLWWQRIWVMLRRKVPHKLEFAYDIVQIHSLSQTWLCTKLLVTQNLQCCVAFGWFQSQKQGTSYPLDSTRTIRPLAVWKSDHCSNFSFVVFT